jgi:3-mercaptopyruvate sulfurtransferase SseA
VRPLEGGLEAWRAAGYPVEALAPNAVLAVDDNGLTSEPDSLAGAPPKP